VVIFKLGARDLRIRHKDNVVRKLLDPRRTPADVNDVPGVSALEPDKVAGFDHSRSHYLETGEKLEIDRQAQQLEDFETYLTLLEEYKLSSSLDLRTHAHWFTKGLHGSRQIREKINILKDGKAIIELVKSSLEEKY